MRALSGIYGAVSAARNSLYETGFLAVRRLSLPVISVGNISTGGTGKTPFVIALGALLAQQGYSFDVLSRGYRRNTRGVLPVDQNGTAEQYGDEPLLISRRLRCPVIVGEDRYAAGAYAERQYPAAGKHAHVLDDGFQHRRLNRDFDIVLLSREDLDDKLLPFGRLREPLSSLGRADVVVVDPEFPIDRLPNGNFQLWRVERHIEVPALAQPVIAFCGIARPQRFFRELSARGIDLREGIAFRDHHRYSQRDVERLLARKQRIPNAQLVTTEKDAVNLGPHLGILNAIVLPMRITIENADSAVKVMLEKIKQRRRG